MAKKKKFIIMPREKETVLNGISTERGHRDFNGKTYMHIDDPGEARDIDLKYGKNGTQEVFVAEDQQYARALEGESWEVQSSLKGDNVKLLHNYTFAQIGTDLPDRKNLVGKKKIINDVPYVYVMRDGKLKLSPAPRRGRGAKPAGARNARGKKDELSQPA